MVASSITLSSDVFRALLSGPSRLPSYWKKISKGHKREESIIHFVAIIIGFLVGTLLSFLVFHDVAVLIREFIHFSRSYQWLINITFALFIATICSSLTFFISKGSIDVYNIYRYGISNSQFAPLEEVQIDKIIDNCKTELVITREGVVELHDTLVKFICAQHYKIEKQKLKAAHWEFRRGSISNACTMHPLVGELVASVMDDQPLSRTFIRNRTGLSILSNYTQAGVSCNTMTDRVRLITQTVEKLLEELIVLQDTLDIATEGTRIRDHPRLKRRSMNGYSRTSSFDNLSSRDESVIVYASSTGSAGSDDISPRHDNKNCQHKKGTRDCIVEIEMQDFSDNQLYLQP